MERTALLTALLIVGLFATQQNVLYAHERFVSVQELSEKNRVGANFKALGNYSGHCINLTVENLTADTAFVWVEPGRRLDNPDSGAQDILVVHEIKLVIPPYAKKTAPVYGFCCQATNAAPAAGTEFGTGQMAVGDLRWIAAFLSKNPYDAGTIQQAVWVFSDNHSTASIVGNKDPKIMGLRKAVAARLNIVLPWYDIHYEKESGRVFSDRHTRLTGDLRFSLNTGGFVLINVRRDNGLLMATLTQDMAAMSGKPYTYPIDMAINDWAKGKYYVNVYLDGNLKQQQEFVL